jgi:hypothetical protein
VGFGVVLGEEESWWKDSRRGVVCQERRGATGVTSGRSRTGISLPHSLIIFSVRFFFIAKPTPQPMPTRDHEGLAVPLADSQHTPRRIWTSPRADIVAEELERPSAKVCDVSGDHHDAGMGALTPYALEPDIGVAKILLKRVHLVHQPWHLDVVHRT